MDTNDGKRQSVCCVCGKRLSAKTPEGGILWQPSQMDDKGLYCDTCFADKKKNKTKKKTQT